LLIAHAIWHAYTGTWALAHYPIWLGAILCSVAVVGYMAAGLGLLRTPLFRDAWRPLTFVAAIASIALTIWWASKWAMPGVLLDLAILVFVQGVAQQRFDADIDVIRVAGASSYRHPRWVRTGWVIGSVALAYVTAVVIMRPTSLRWGSTPDERAASLPGDDVLPSRANYRIDHAITIRASASAVWPWLVQLGQDRGGFYSYDWLERAFGDDIQNADRIHPEWQSRAVGDTIFATQRSYFGARFGGLGWRVNTLEPQRVIGLENWGTFVLRPIDSATTRLIVRTRGQTPPSVASFVFAPVDVFVFEPMHFIMERAMLRGIRARAEGANASH
jgi:hypothetical protein